MLLWSAMVRGGTARPVHRKEGVPAVFFFFKQKTAYEMNLRAAKEIARQLRLRDLGGVIVNDFIDMRDERHRRGVEKALRDAIKRDRARTKVLQMSAFGLIEMTRQRIR